MKRLRAGWGSGRLCGLMTNPKTQSVEPARARSRRWGWWLAGLGLLAVVAFSVQTFVCASGASQSDPLAGRWVRPDGGYVLELTGPDEAGLLTAAYFNPLPIHVARTEWKDEKGQLTLFIELRAPNYPGSTYTLTYVPDTDQLAGIYYQAAQQQQYEVIFDRLP